MPPKKVEARKNKRTRHRPRETKDTEKSLVATVGQKRSASKVTGDNEKDGKSSKKIRDDHDKYCFICHQLGQEMLCSTCPRTYHEKCLLTAKKVIGSQCFQCEEEEIARKEFKRMPYFKLKELLLEVIRRVTPDESSQLKHISNWPAVHEYLCHVIDIERMIDKCRDEEHHYDSPVELLGEFKWILHNCAIIFGEISSPIKTARNIVQKCQFELDDLFDCVDCYIKKSDPKKFVKFCNPPHPIVWAKVKGYPYWPAKFLRVVDGHAHVRFFYTHQSSSKVKDCLFMSENYPTVKGQRKPTGMKFVSAMSELKDYIEKFENKYGPFPYEPQNKVFNYEKGMETMKEILDKISAPAVKKLRPSNSVRIANRTVSPNVLIDLTDEEDRSVRIKSSPPLSPSYRGEDITVVGRVENIVDSSITMIEEGIVLEDNNVEANNNVEADNNVYVGRLFPGNHRKNIDINLSESTFPVLEETNLSVPFSETNSPVQFSEASISIQNVISAADVPQLLNLQDQSESTVSQVPYPVIISSVSELQKQPQINTIDSNALASPVQSFSSQQLTPNKTTYSENIASVEDDDDDIIVIPPPPDNTKDTSVNDMAMSMIAATDPNSNEMLKKSIEILKDHMVQFWLRACGTPNLVNLVKNKDSRINSLKEEKQKLKATISQLECKCEEIRKNATFLLNNTNISTYQKICELEQQKKDFEQQNKELIEKLKNKSYSPPPSIKDKCDQEVQTDVNLHQLLSFDERTADALLEAKLKPHCKVCHREAKIFCCWNGRWHTNYCSQLCQEQHRKSHAAECRKKQRCNLELTPKQYQENQTLQTFRQQQCVIQQLVTTFPTVPQQTMDEEAGKGENSANVRASMSKACTSVYACTSTRERVSITSNKTMMSRSDTKELSDKKTGKES